MRGSGTIELNYQPADDPKITCVRCWHTGCAFEIVMKTSRGRAYLGLCAACRAYFVLEAAGTI